MFLIGMARELIESHAARAPAPPAASVPETSDAYPGTVVRPGHLRRLIDECFLYLSAKQRGEIFDALHGALLDPKNAAVRGAMIEYFAHKALAVRAVQIRLAQLSTPEKEALAAEFGREVAALPPEEQAKFGELLRKSLLPVPQDLNQLLLAAFDAR
jgi:hypothetical protein